MKNISILGSTGSIGTQTLDVARNLEDINVVGLSAKNNIELLEKQIYEFKPSKVAVMNEQKAKELKQRVSSNKVEILSGIEGLCEVACIDEVQVVVTAVVGMIGLVPTVSAIKAKKNIALANKETLVTAGSIIMNLAKENGVNIYPVDSEHSAIFQCLQGNDKNDLNKILLTASGGPFRGYSLDNLKNVTLSDALKHPNWSMGKKITIDSATLMNKGLEVIEAKWLFNVSLEQIEVLIHPQSIIHSMVEYNDGTVIAQLGSPDMRVPIQYALTYPKRINNSYPKLDFQSLKDLTFEKPDSNVFKCFKLAYDAIKCGGTMPTVLNSANECAVDLFLNSKITFLQIADIIENVMSNHRVVKAPNINEILETEQWVNEFIESRWF